MEKVQENLLVLRDEKVIKLHQHIVNLQEKIELSDPKKHKLLYLRIVELRARYRQICINIDTYFEIIHNQTLFEKRKGYEDRLERVASQIDSFTFSLTLRMNNNMGGEENEYFFLFVTKEKLEKRCKFLEKICLELEDFINAFNKFFFAIANLHIQSNKPIPSSVFEVRTIASLGLDTFYYFNTTKLLDKAFEDLFTYFKERKDYT
jgi:hypothetical protein